MRPLIGFQRYLFVLLLTGFLVVSCHPQKKPHFTSSHLTELDSSIVASPKVEAYISPLRDSIESIMNEVIGQSAKEMFPRKPGTALSNFVADMLRDAAIREIQNSGKEQYPVISVINIKGLRSPVSKGDITIRDIYSLMPFENKMVILKLSGKEITELFNHIGISDGDGIAGATFTFKNQQLLSTQIDGRPTENKKNYYVATSDYLADGGDHYTVFAKASEKYTSDNKIRDLIISRIRELAKQGKTINPPNEKRILFE